MDVWVSHRFSFTPVPVITHVCVCAPLLSRVRLFAAPWPVARQAPPSMGFSRQEYWSGLPFPSPGHLPDAGTGPASSALAGGFFTTDPPRKSPNTRGKQGGQALGLSGNSGLRRPLRSHRALPVPSPLPWTPSRLRVTSPCPGSGVTGSKHLCSCYRSASASLPLPHSPLDLHPVSPSRRSASPELAGPPSFPPPCPDRRQGFLP